MKEFSTCSFCKSCRLAEDDSQPPCYQDICSFLESAIPLISQNKTGWRLKARLAVRGTVNDPKIGLFREGTHEVIDMAYCPAHHPSINEATLLLRESMQRLQILPYDEKRGLGACATCSFSSIAKPALCSSLLSLAINWR
jgi:tRNA/tmRNA/rRNA uracil-C5-methylase (TrmA/RlmC/RlmD family)